MACSAATSRTAGRRADLDPGHVQRRADVDDAVRAAAGVLGGLLRDVAPDTEAIWKLTFPDQALFRLLRKHDLRLPAFSLVCVLGILLAEFLRSTMAVVFPNKGVFALQLHWQDEGPWLQVAVYATTLLSILLPIKIWNSSRTEKKLELQQLRLNEARLAALSRQINPHFLFNTLNSVTSLIRLDPHQARQMVVKLSNILRRLLRQQDNLTPLREELSFIDDYLAIEMVRFGDTLHFVKDTDPDTLDLLVPSMLLQPLVENSIRHGLSSKVDGGTIRERSRLMGGRLQILIEDDGVGIPEAKLATLFEQGIGVSNVNERLKGSCGRARCGSTAGPAKEPARGSRFPSRPAARPRRWMRMRAANQRKMS
jgi:two-component system LytT family sensor kinase